MTVEKTKELAAGMAAKQQQTKPEQAIAKAPITITACCNSDRWKAEVAKVIPSYLTPESMLRIARSVATDPKFARCSPDSFLIALIKCSQAGLVPDGRNAHLIPFGTEVQCIFDWKGIVALVSRNGYEVVPKIVFSNDVFNVEEDDGTGTTRVHHVVDYKRARGEIVLFYSRCKNTKSGTVDYEFMTPDEVEYVRNTYSRAKDSSPWAKSWEEMGKKTVIKRHSKRWDLAPEIAAAINSDDDSASPVVEVKTSKPLFGPTVAIPERVQAVEESPVEESPAAPAQTDTNGGPVSTLRENCRKANIAEGELLGHLYEVGASDGSSTTIEELAMSQPEVVLMLTEKWPDIAGKIIEGRKNGGAK